ELLPAEDAWNRAAAAWALGYAQRSLGHLAEARSAFEEQIRLGRGMGNIWTLVSGMNDLAMVQRAEGKLAEARAMLEAALQEALQQGARGLGYLARMESGLAAVLYEQNELDAALALLNGATAHLSLWPNPNHQAYAHAIKTRVLLAMGERKAAGAEVEKAAAVARALPLTRVVQRIVETAQVALAQAKGDLHLEAGQIVQRWQVELEELAVLDESADLAALALARVWLANGEAQRVKPLMLRVIQAAQPAGRVANLTSAYLMAAIAAQSTDPRDANAALGQALAYGQRAGFTRLFIDEGPAARMLLAGFLSTALPGALRDYALHLVSQFPEPAQSAAQQSALPELLSAREMEVLALLAQGATNQEIAARLVLAPGTVKAHTASIYRKLDAPNRTAAVAKARDLRLLD
ncbi:MAG TPA: LuxR C-terminal-related transcriptional regulator, partial [Anaerolineaceae bacterium]